MTHPDPAVVGVDGCKTGWLWFRQQPAEGVTFGVATGFRSLLDTLPPGTRVLVDIPIGLLEDGDQERACDLEARRLLAPRRQSSVFPTPCRQAVYASGHPEANELNRRTLGRGLSKQSWALAPKIREVDEVLRARRHTAVVRESHPEVCFGSLAGAPLTDNKKARAGFTARLEILEAALPGARTLAGDAFLHHGGFECARDDVLDAMVLMVTARDWEQGATVPGHPPLDPCGLPMEIVHPGRTAPVT